MKKTIIGFIFLTVGSLIFMRILELGVEILPTISSWSGNKLMYTIFSKANVGLPFIFSIVLSLIGVTILGIEYFKK